ncbi:MAG: IS91 family transposase [Desulfobacteraceae bacterium]
MITPKENTSAYEVADIFRLYSEEYLADHRITKKQYNVIRRIRDCRTEANGYHIDQCDSCGHIEQSFNSCRDRHCPKCQGISQRKWIESRLEDILPVPYYHVVFTLPHFLNEVISYNKRLVYELLMGCSSETLLAFGQDSQWLGGEIGFYGILHTWGQTLWPHVHVHYIVPGGALSDDNQWIEPKHDDKFLFPVHSLSKVFRGKFIERFKAAHHGQKIVLPDTLSHLSDPQCFERWIDQLVARNWVVYCKRPFADAPSVVRYIGRYTHRVAISNNRIVDITDNKVRFLYKDYKASRIVWLQMTLQAKEFIRRFIWHVLPNRFHKIRHYGFLANGKCKEKVQYIRTLLNAKTSAVADEDDTPTNCPVCRKGLLAPILIVTKHAQRMLSRFYIANPRMVYDTS